MLDIRLIREQTAFVKAELGKAGVDEAEIDRVVECDAERRRLQRELDEMRARRTRESKELGRMAPGGARVEAGSRCARWAIRYRRANSNSPRSNDASTI